MEKLVGRAARALCAVSIRGGDQYAYWSPLQTAWRVAPRQAMLALGAQLGAGVWAPRIIAAWEDAHALMIEDRPVGWEPMGTQGQR